MKTPISEILILLLVLSTGVSRADTKSMTDKEKLSYAIGAQFAHNIMQQPFELDTNTFVEAIRDTLDGKQLKLTTDEIRQVLVAYQQQQIKLQEDLAKKNKAA